MLGTQAILWLSWDTVTVQVTIQFFNDAPCYQMIF